MTNLFAAVVLGSALVAVAASPVLQHLVDRLCIGPSASPRRPSADASGRLGSRAPGIVLAGGLVIAGLVAPGVEVFALLALGLVLLVVVSMVDLAERRIPNRVTYPAIAGCLAAAAIGGATLGQADAAASALAGGATFAAVLLGLHWLRPDAMGLGDVKLVFPLGFAIGWSLRDAAMAPAAIGVTLMTASLIGLATVVGPHLRRPGAPLRGRSIPFGPPLSIAAALTIVAALGFS